MPRKSSHEIRSPSDACPFDEIAAIQSTAGRIIDFRAFTMTGNLICQRLARIGVQLADYSNIPWVTEHPHQYLLFELHQKSMIHIPHTAGCVTSYRVSLWSHAWERVSRDVILELGQPDGKPGVLVYDLDWGEMWMQRMTDDYQSEHLSMLYLRLERVFCHVLLYFW